MKISEKISRFFAKRSVRAGLVFSLVAAISGTVTYFMMPNFISGDATYTPNDSDDGDLPDEMSSVDHFASKLIETTGVEGKLDLSVVFPDKDEDENTNNVIKIDDADLRIAIPSTSNIGFDFAGTINYNDWNETSMDKATMHVNLADKNAYIDMWGAKIAYLDTEYKSLIGELIAIFSDSVVKVPDSVYDLLDKLGGDSSSGDSGSGLGSLTDTTIEWDLVTEGDTQNEYQLDIDLEGTIITLHLFSDKDYNLTRVYAKDIKYEGITINVDFVTEINENALGSIRALTPTDKENYTSLMGLKGVIRKVGSTIAKERFNLDMDLKINHSSESVDENINVALDGSFDIDGKEYIADLALSNGSDDSYSQNLGIAYLTNNDDSNAYLNYNDITKASMNLLTLEAMLERMQNDGNSQDMSYLAKLFDFVFDSEVVKAIQKGRYEIIADEVEKIEVSANKIIAKVKLDKVGLGSNSLVTLTFDGTSGAPIANVSISGVKAKDFSLEGNIDVITYRQDSFSAKGYYKMEHLPDIYDQISDLVNEKQASLSLNGSILNQDNLGVSLIGGASFDANVKEGTGSIKLEQLSSNYTKNHIFTLDVNEQKALFNYNDYDKKDEYAGLNGFISISNINDLVEFIQDLSGEDSFNKRFGGIFSSLQEDSANTIINDVLDGKYASLISSKILNKCDISTSGIDMVINGELFALDSDIEIVIAFKDTQKVEEGKTDEIIRNIESVTLKDFAISDMKINLTLTLNKYDAKLSSLDESLDYIDFSSVTNLAECALNTASRLDTYHLKGDMSVILWTADIISLDIDLYISLEEEGMKIYGVLDNIPLIPAVNNDTWLFGDHGEDASFYRSVSFYYDEENIYLHGVNPFGIFEAEDDEGIKTSYDLTEMQDYKYDTSYFEKTDNIINFMLKDVVNLQSRLLNKIDMNGLSLPESKKALATEKLLNTFAYDADELKWNLSLDLGGLLENDFLKTLDLTFGANSSNYLTSLELALTVFAGVKIQLLGDFSLENVGKDTFPTESFNAYVNEHINDEVSAK